jgi:hypothetical protein
MIDSMRSQVSNFVIKVPKNYLQDLAEMLGSTEQKDYEIPKIPLAIDFIVVVYGAGAGVETPAKKRKRQEWDQTDFAPIILLPKKQPKRVRFECSE